MKPSTAPPRKIWPFSRPQDELDDNHHHQLRLDEIEISTPAPEPSPAATLKSTEPQAVETPTPVSNDAIGPYSEPLVGPMSVLPGGDHDLPLSQAPVTATDLSPGMPAPRVYAPLNTARELEDTVTADATLIDAIAQFDPSASR